MGSYGLFWLAKGGVVGATNNGEFVTPLIHRRDLGWQLTRMLNFCRTIMVVVADR